MPAKADIDFDVMKEMLNNGASQRDIAAVMDVSEMTISRRVAELEAVRAVVEGYRKVQGVHLTQLQMKILEAMDDEEKLMEAPLRDLVTSFKILKDKELVMEGKPTDIKGLVGLLLELENENGDGDEEGEIIDVTPEENPLPRL